MTRGWFVTGTDTGVGKTRVACALVTGWAARGWRSAGLKPVAAGCRLEAAGWRSDDATALAACANVDLPYEIINPYALAEPVAPHIAAREAGVTLELDVMRETYRRAAAQADIVVVEGAGGWLTPLDESRTLADLAQALGLPVILVVGLRLGCINHALLTQDAVARAGLTLAGWVGNIIEPGMTALDANIETLKGRLAAPCIGLLAYDPAADAAQTAARLALESLKN